MSDLYTDGAASPVSSAHQPWYRRRANQIAVAGTLAAGIAVAGLALGSSASASVEPQDAVAEAAENLRALPSGVTISGGEQSPGDITVVRTDEGVQVTMDAPERGAEIGVALVDERLFLRVSAPGLDGVTGNPLALAATSAFPSLVALMQGEWVSLDVSADSEVLAAVQDLQAGQVDNPEAVETAVTDLTAALQAIGEDARGVLQSALQDNVEVLEPVQPKTGPADSTHYEVVIDRQAIVEELEPTMRQALTDALTAVDAFVAEVGDQLPGGGAMWEQARAEIESKVEQSLTQRADQQPSTIDVWVADGEFTRIVVADATLDFDPSPELSAPDVAVSMDQDLLALLPLLEQFDPQSLLGQQFDPQSLLGEQFDLESMLSN